MDEPAKSSTASRPGVKSADRALSILELLVHADQPLTFADIAAALGYPRSSLFGLLTTLLNRGWIDLDERARTYRLGIRAFEAGNAYERSISLLPIALPHMERIRGELDETVQISVLEGRFNIYLGKVEGGQRLRLASEVGRRLEAHATALGKMILADVPEADLNALFQGVTLETFTPNTIATLAALKEDLARSRERGYAVDDEEYTQGLRCYALPIRNHTGRTVAAMSVSFPTVRLTDDRGLAARALLETAVTQISAVLGYQGLSPMVSEQRDFHTRVVSTNDGINRERHITGENHEYRSGAAQYPET